MRGSLNFLRLSNCLFSQLRSELRSPLGTELCSYGRAFDLGISFGRRLGLLRLANSKACHRSPLHRGKFWINTSVVLSPSANILADGRITALKGFRFAGKIAKIYDVAEKRTVS